MPNMIQAALKELGNVIVIQGDIYLPALFSRTHQAFIAETAQLVRNSRFAQPDERHQVAHIHLSTEQRGNDAQASGVGEGIEQAGELASGGFVEMIGRNRCVHA